MVFESFEEPAVSIKEQAVQCEFFDQHLKNESRRMLMLQIMNFEGTHMSEFICSSVLMVNKENFTALLFTKFVSILSLIILEFFYR